MDYTVYYFSKAEKARYLAEGLLLIAIAAYLFYSSPIAILPGLPYLYFHMKWKRKDLAEARIHALTLQFREGIRCISAALQTGFSPENAIREAIRELKLLDIKDNYMIPEFEEMRGKICSGQTVEDAFYDFALRTGISDAVLFADIFHTAKRGGQDLVRVISSTVRTISEKLETEEVIQTSIASRKYELNVMTVMPFAMLFYLRITGGDFLEMLYTTWAGRLIMTVCLLLYIVIWRLSQYMLRISL